MLIRKGKKTGFIFFQSRLKPIIPSPSFRTPQTRATDFSECDIMTAKPFSPTPQLLPAASFHIPVPRRLSPEGCKHLTSASARESQDRIGKMNAVVTQNSIPYSRKQHRKELSPLLVAYPKFEGRERVAIKVPPDQPEFMCWAVYK